MKKLVMTAMVAAGMTAMLPAQKAQAQEPFLGQIAWFAGNFAPRGWAFCDGQILPINQNQSLYSLLGTTYGGDGRTSFALPDVRGRTPLHVGQGPGAFSYVLGQRGGAERVTLTVAEMPSHTHTTAFKASNAEADGATPGGGTLTESVEDMYLEGASTLDATMVPNSLAVSNAGGSQSHENRQPYGTLNCIIAMQGLFPSRN